MANANKRFLVGNTVYIINTWSNGTVSGIALESAEITCVDKKAKRIVADNHEDLCKWYSFEDYDAIFFYDINKAYALFKSIPNPKTTVYTIEGEVIIEKTVKAITAKETDKSNDIVIEFVDGKSVSVRECGKSVFLYLTDAVRNL